MTRLTFVLFTALSTGALSFAASISGILTDPSSRPVQGATVRCGDRTVQTGPEGRFTIDAPAACDATITQSGFETLRATLEPGREARLSLRLAALSESVVVSATRAPIAVDEAGVATTVVTKTDLEARDFPGVYDVLRETPGLVVADSGRRGALTTVYTRGTPRTGTLFLLDGVPLNEPGGEMNLAHISTAGIARIETVRGPESALFGAEAAGGVVQLFTERGDPESARPRGSVSYERGSFQTDRWMANLNGGLWNKLDYSFTADQFHTVGQYQNDYWRDTTGTASVGYRFSPSTQVRGIFRTYDAIAGNPNQVGWGLFDSDANGEDRSSAVSVKVDDVRGAHYFQRVSFSYSRLRDRFNDVISDGPFNVAALVRDANTPTPRVYLDKLVPYDFPQSSTPAGDRLVQNSVTLYAFPGLTFSDRKTFDYQGTVTHEDGALVFGYEFERQQGLISNSNVSRDNNGLFVHEQYSLGRRISLTGGARVERSSVFGTKFAPRGSATFLLVGEHRGLSSTYLRFSAGRGITEPSLLENFAREDFYVGNPRLKPETIDNFEAGLVQELFGRRVRAEATAFRNSFKDLIVYDGSNYPGTWNNIDRSWARGVETSVTVKPIKYVSVTSSWMRLYTRITQTLSADPYSGVGQDLPRQPRNSGAITLQIAPRRWTFVAGGRFIGERRDADFVFNVTRNPAYSNAFVSASYNATRHVTPYLRIDNVTNAYYADVLGYPALSRNAIGGVRVNW